MTPAAAPLQAAAVWFSFMLVIFTNVQLLSKSQAGALMLIGQARFRRRSLAL